MSYVPQNVSVFVAAFSGALSGMGISGKVPTDPLPASYDSLSVVASAYAQAFDLTWGPIVVPTTFDLEMIQSTAEAAWQERAPQVASGTVSITVGTYVPIARALIAAIRSGENYLAGQGIVPAPVGAVASVSGTLPISSTGGANPFISIAAATDAAAGSMSGADKTKLDGIGAGALVVSVGGTLPISSTGGANPVVSIAAATGAAAGSMSGADKTALDGTPAAIVAAANAAAAAAVATSEAYTDAHAVTAVGAAAPITTTGGLTPQIGISAATTGAAGSFSATDKTKIDGLQKQGAAVVIAALDIDWSLGSIYRLNLGTPGNVVTFSNNNDGKLIIVMAHSNGGGSTITWPAGVFWVNGVVPVQTPTGISGYTLWQEGTSIFGAAGLGYAVP